MAPRNNPRNPNDATATLSLPPVFGSSFLSSAFTAGA